MGHLECNRTGYLKGNVNGRFRINGVCTLKRVGVGADSGDPGCARSWQMVLSKGMMWIWPYPSECLSTGKEKVVQGNR